MHFGNENQIKLANSERCSSWAMKDILDNLAHDVRNALTVIFFIAQKMGTNAKKINEQAKRMKDAFDLFENEIRECPYAGQDGSKCKLCKKPDSQGKKEN